MPTRLIVLLAGLVAAAAIIAATLRGGDAAALSTAALLSHPSITEAKLPPGFSQTPAVSVNGKRYYAKAVKAANATVYGKVPPGFDHWHAFQGGGSKVGTWYTHIPVQTFTFAGPPGNPFEGKTIAAGTPKFLPVCDILQ